MGPAGPGRAPHRRGSVMRRGVVLSAVALSALMVGCSSLSGLTGGLPLAGSISPGSALRQQSDAALRQKPPLGLFGALARMRAVSLSVYNTNRGVAPIISNNSSSAVKRILAQDTATDSAQQDQTDDRPNSDGSLDETVKDASGQVNEDFHVGAARHQTDADGNDNASLDLDVKADVSGRTGHYSLKKTKDASGSVLSGEINFRDDDLKTEKTVFKKDLASGHLKVSVSEPDGSNGDLDESDDGQGNVQVSGTLKQPDGTAASVSVGLNKDGTAQVTANGATFKTSLTFLADGTGKGDVRDAAGSKIGDVVFGRDKRGTLTMLDGTKTDLLLK